MASRGKGRKRDIYGRVLRKDALPDPRHQGFYFDPFLGAPGAPTKAPKRSSGIDARKVLAAISRSLAKDGIEVAESTVAENVVVDVIEGGGEAFHTYKVRFTGAQTVDKRTFAAIRRALLTLRKAGYTGEAIPRFAVEEREGRRRAEHWASFPGRSRLDSALSDRQWSQTGGKWERRHNYESIRGFSILVRAPGR